MKTNQRIGLSRSKVFKASLIALAMAALAACGTRTAAPAATSAPAATNTAAPAPAEATVTTAATEAATATAEATAAPAAAAVYKIDATQSKATFTLNEELIGNPKTVVGETADVSGEITLTPDNLADTKIGIIQINARAFKTDSNMRNGAIQRFILESNKDEYQFITFEPTAIEGLPASVKTGESATIKITGNLKIRTVTQPVKFDTTVTAKSDAEIAGTAKTTVTRSAFQLEVPSVPSVANVTDEVALELMFVATKQ